MKKYKISFLTFGCKVNNYDTAIIQEELKKYHLHNDPEGIPLAIVNSCAVTEDAVLGVQRSIRQFKRKNPHSIIILTGCAAQVESSKFSQMNEVDAIIDNTQKESFGEKISLFLESKVNHFTGNIFDIKEISLRKGQALHRQRPFLRIQDGCNAYCSYCIIPFARGQSRSVPQEDIIHMAQNFEEQNIHEVFLTGIHIGDYSYGEDRLEHLLEKLIQNTNKIQFRLGSLNPLEITPRLLEIASHPRICSHFHLSIQHFHENILKAMNRPYSFLQIEEILWQISQKIPHVFMGMDLIVGFPKETEKEFIFMKEKLEQLPWTYAHVFPFSPRKGTAAEKLHDFFVKEPLKKERAQILRELSQKRYFQESQKQVHQTLWVYILHNHENTSLGICENNWSIQIPQIIPPHTLTKVLVQNVILKNEEPLLQGIIF